MALSSLRASHALVPVFAVAGGGGRAAADMLRLDERLRVVSTPRHAAVLLIVGDVADDMEEPLRRLHDALPEPRATIWWDLAAGTAPALPASRLDAGADVGAVCVDTLRELLGGGRTSEPPALPNVERHPWRGVGPYGQGGSGMTGGTPYGRPIANRADDPSDLLALDVVPLTVGPFFAALPHGMQLRVTLQGDVIHELEVVRLPPRARSAGDAFQRATREQVTVAALERERAASHLRWLAHALRLVGLDALGERALRLSVAPSVEGVQRLDRAVARTVRHVVSGIGVLDAASTSGRGLGPVARAAGVVEDARLDDASYTMFGFEPVVGYGGDAWARWRQRIDETLQSLHLMEVAGGMLTGGDGRTIEGPHGPIDGAQIDTLAGILPGWLVGQEWGDAVTALASLDLNPDTQQVKEAVA